MDIPFLNSWRLLENKVSPFFNWDRKTVMVAGHMDSFFELLLDHGFECLHFEAVSVNKDDFIRIDVP